MIQIDLQAAAHGLDDAHIGLVGHEKIDIGGRKTVALQQFLANAGHLAHGVLVDFTALHGDEKVVAHGIAGLVLAGGAAAHDDEVVQAAVALTDAVLHAGQGVLGIAVQDAGAGAVTEEHAGAAVAPVDAAGKGLGADEEDLGSRVLAEQGVRQMQAVQEAGAGGAEVEGHGRAGTDVAADDAGQRRCEMVGRTGGGQDMGQLGRVETGIFQRLAGGIGPEVGGVLFLRQAVATLDAGTGGDPLVVGLHQFAQIVVGQDLGGDVAAEGVQIAVWLHRDTRGLNGA